MPAAPLYKRFVSYRNPCTKSPRCWKSFLSLRAPVLTAWKNIMSRKSQLTTPACVILPFAVLSFGLGYFASSRRRKTIAEHGRAMSDESEEDVVQVQTPQPDWTPGQKQPPPQGLDKGHVQVDPRDCKSCYALMVSAVIPRPVAFVSTQAADGTVNLSPFSYFNTVGHDPPMLAVSICRNHDGGKKDTLVNIEASGEFVVSIISDWFVEAANHTCGSFPPDVDEMELSGLTPAKSTVVSPPRVKESGMNMECKVHHMYEIVNHKGNCTTTVVFGEVVMFHMFSHLLDQAGAAEGKPCVHLKGYKPISRLGGNTYARLGSAFDLRRPNVKK